jgi:hypothetical protein
MDRLKIELTNNRGNLIVERERGLMSNLAVNYYYYYFPADVFFV